MGSRLLILVLALGCAASSCPKPGAQLPEDPPERALESHVRVGVVVSHDDGSVAPGAIGAGTVIANSKGRTYILTAGHATTVPEPADGVRYKLGVWFSRDSHPVNARLERLAEDGIDAAVISTRSTDHRVAQISGGDPTEGERVFVLGSPSNTFRAAYQRRVLEFRARVDDRLHSRVRIFALDGPILHGFSGGGAYNWRAELVGICYGIWAEEKDRGACIPIETLRPLISQYVE